MCAGLIELKFNLTQFHYLFNRLQYYCDNCTPTIAKMHYRDAFNDTLEKFGISAKSLALKTGVQERQISLFRNGKNLMAETLFSLIKALPDEAQLYFHASAAGESILGKIRLESLIGSMTIEEKLELLKDIADSLSPKRIKEEGKKIKVEKDTENEIEKQCA